MTQHIDKYIHSVTISRLQAAWLLHEFHYTDDVPLSECINQIERVFGHQDCYILIDVIKTVSRMMIAIG